jgi:uncharacterized damage-inducible protein DinB
MSGKDLLFQYTQFNLWANKQMINWLLTKDQNLMNEALISSFPTINKTLSHIWIAEHLWMCRIENIAWSNLINRHDGLTTNDISEDLIASSTYYIDKIIPITESELEERIDYKLLSGDIGHASVMYIIHHVMNHSTYHRGQLVTMGRELGFMDPPKTDFMHYVSLNNL